MELGEQVEDVERQPAEGKHQGDGGQQEVCLPLAATAAFLLAVPRLVRRLACGAPFGLLLLLAVLRVLIDHAVAQLVADAEVSHGEDDEGQDVLDDHLGHGVGPLLHLQVFVLRRQCNDNINMMMVLMMMMMMMMTMMMMMKNCRI